MSKDMLSVVSDCCEEFLSFSNDFWFVMLLLDRGFEVGNKKKSDGPLESYREHGLSDTTMVQLEKRGNNNFVELVKKHPDITSVTANTEYPHRDKTFAKVFPDLRFGPKDTSDDVILEIKMLFDLAIPKFYQREVAYDRQKLLHIRSTGFNGQLFQVVFFSQLPGYKYPRGKWAPTWKQFKAREEYPGKRGIDAQYQYVLKFLKEKPAWPKDGPIKKPLGMPSPNAMEAISSRFNSPTVFKPD